MPHSSVDWQLVGEELARRGFTVRDRPHPAAKTSGLINAFNVLPLVEVVTSGGSVLSGGKGSSYVETVRTALAEAIERIVASEPTEDRILVQSASELAPQDIVVPHLHVGERDAYTPQTRIDWLPGWTIDGLPAVIPAELAFFPYIPIGGVRAFATQHTHGLAVGASLEEAIWAGIAECAERDAYCILMRCHAQCPTIHVSQLSGRVVELSERAAQAGLRLVFKDISFDWPLHIVHATLMDVSGRVPAFAHGLGSHTNLLRAAEKSLAECIQLHADLRRLCEADLAAVLLPTDSQGLRKSAPAIWADPASKRLFGHLVDEANSMRTGEAISSYEPSEIVSEVERLVGSIFWAELGGLGGLRGIRAMIPECMSPAADATTVTPRLAKWLSRLNLTFPYDAPLLL